MAGHPRRIRIVGLGLIGGSLGIALGRAGWHVEFIDPAVSRDDARAADAASRKLEAIDGADDSPVVIATPVDAAIMILRETAFGVAPVTSVCSVMEPLRKAALDRSLTFVAGHPFAGKEARSLAAADPELFEGCRWFVDEGRRESFVEGMIDSVHAVVHPIDPAEHDRILALTSHLPQVLSTALGALIAERKVDDAFLGSGLETFLRLAGSDRAVWQAVLAENRQHVDVAARDLTRIVGEILDGDSSEAFDLARRTYERLSGK